MARYYDSLKKDWPDRLELSLIDKAMMALGLLVVIITIGRTAMVYPSLPDIIPTNFGSNGEVTGTDGKFSLLILVGADVFCWALMVVCNFFPQAINVPVFLLRREPIDIIRGTRLYLNVTILIVAAMFYYILETTIRVATGVATAMGMGIWVFMALIIITIIIYFIWLAKG